MKFSFVMALPKLRCRAAHKRACRLAFKWQYWFMMCLVTCWQHNAAASGNETLFLQSMDCLLCNHSTHVAFYVMLVMPHAGSAWSQASALARMDDWTQNCVASARSSVPESEVIANDLFG